MQGGHAFMQTELYADRAQTEYADMIKNKIISLVSMNHVDSL